MALSKSQLKQLKKRLTELESEVSADVANGRQASAPVTLDQQAVGRVSRMDAIQQQQMQLASLQRMEKRLSMIKAAIVRLDTEDFGLCTMCEEPIPFDRLQARPESPLCLECAKKQ